MKGSAVRVRASASVVERARTWASRDLPLLAATLRRVEADDFSVSQLEAIREELEISPPSWAGLNALDSTRL